MTANSRVINKDTTILEARGLTKTFHRGGWRRSQSIRALNSIELLVSKGSVVGIVGESGSGKSTLARCLAMLEPLDEGELWFDQRDLTKLSKADLAQLHPQIQLIFQDAATAFNPRFSAIEIVSEPQDIQGKGTQKQRRQAALELMEQVGIPSISANRTAAQFSGGQKQRLAIARALSLEPKLLIFDESLSGLDLSIQVHIIDLLLALRAARSLTYIFISHDLGLVARLADEVIVMHTGEIVERAIPEKLLSTPQHVHTQALVAAIPRLDSITSVPQGGR